MFRSQNDTLFDRDDEFTEGDVQFFGGVVVGARPIQLNHQHLWHCQGLPLSGPLGRHLGSSG